VKIRASFSHRNGELTISSIPITSMNVRFDPWQTLQLHQAMFSHSESSRLSERELRLVTNAWTGANLKTRRREKCFRKQFCLVVTLNFRRGFRTDLFLGFKLKATVTA
jgi:hypothetical protein